MMLSKHHVNKMVSAQYQIGRWVNRFALPLIWGGGVSNNLTCSLPVNHSMLFWAPSQKTLKEGLRFAAQKFIQNPASTFRIGCSHDQASLTAVIKKCVSEVIHLLHQAEQCWEETEGDNGCAVQLLLQDQRQWAQDTSFDSFRCLIRHVFCCWLSYIT